MGTELSYLDETTEESRVTSLLSKLADGFSDSTDSEWQSDIEPGWNKPAPEEACQIPKTWQVLNSNSSQNSVWASQGDGIQVKWAHLARQDAGSQGSTSAQLEFRSDPKIVPCTGQDEFRSTQEMEAEWQAALAGEGAFAMATADRMGAALSDLVCSRLGTGLQESIDLLEDALENQRSLVELPTGAAIVDLIWELHGEMEWNSSFKAALTEHLGLTDETNKQRLLQSLVQKLETCQQSCKHLHWLQKRFQHLVQKALEENLEVEACEREQDDPFAKLLQRLGVATPARSHQDIICQSLDEIGC